MKLSTLLLLGILGLIGYGFVHEGLVPMHVTFGDASTPAPEIARKSAPSAPRATPAPHLPPMSGTLRSLIAKGGEGLARNEFAEYLRTAPRIEARGTVERHTDDGHVFVSGTISVNHSAHHEDFLLYGLPEAEELADGEIFDCYAVMGNPVAAGGGARIREYIFVDESGNRPARFERASPMYQ